MASEKRLIDANALKEYLNSLEASGGHKYYRKGVDDTLHVHIPNIVDEQSTVDAVEVVHGWWIELPSMEPDYKCSECGQSYAWWEPNEAHYCPNCGAKMDGDGNG